MICWFNCLFPRNAMTSIEDLIPLRKDYKPPAEVEVVKFEDPEKKLRNTKRKLAEENEKVNALQPKPGKEVKSLKYSKQLTRELNSMNFEIQRFTTQSLNRKERLEAERKQLIKLGAEPPKKKNINYKELMAQRKEERDKYKEEREIARLQGIVLPKDPPKLTGGKKKSKNERAKELFGSEKFENASDGQMGSYRKGFQVLSSSDLKRVKTSKSLKL